MGALIGIFFSSLGIGLSGALMPGPMLSVTIAEAYKKGFWAGPLIVLGHAIPEFVLMVLFSLGLNRFIKDDTVQGVIGIVGGVFLGFLAVKIFIEARRGITVDLTAKQEIGWGPVVAGTWTSISNPGWIIWWATIGAKYILISLEHGIVGLAFFFVGHELADLLWYSLVSFLVSRGRGRISDRVYHGLLYGCSVMVLFFAAFFIYNGIRTI
ncbi:MAG: LysE family translocator [Actinobacteria bacterium]|nr:LysE family translocator [Actinomycetota bacterium]MBU1942091.1 LysE family translocator [Actinomycetota bacterium]MBU2687352.1 LysE family translocator [Actinomycetota bacterium]